MKYDNNTIQQINNSINIVDYASQYLDLKESKGEYWCQCCFHDGDINPSLSFNKEKNTFYCFSCEAKGSTIQFIMFYHKKSFPETIRYMIEYGNLTITPKEHSEILDYLQKTNRKQKVKDIEHIILPIDVMNKYTKKPIIEWINEGISQDILEDFNVRYDLQNNKIIFPIQDIDGNIISIKGRSLYKNHSELGIPKYIYYQSIGSNDFLFGLHRNKKYIQEKNEVIIVESEKSVMKLCSWGFNNIVALCTKKINDKQMELLLSLKCNLIFAFDKDVKEKDVIKEIVKLSKFTNVFYICDKNNYLSDKDAPCDKTKEIWEILYNQKIKI